jgi:hypothetical protein
LPGRLIEARPVGVYVFAQCAVLIGIGPLTTSKEFHLPHVAMPCPCRGNGFRVSEQEHSFPFRCPFIGQLA